MEEQGLKQTRRAFIKTAGAALAGAAAVGVVGCTNKATGGSGASDNIKWEEEYDVIVVGAGLAGTTAAVTVASEGKDLKCLLLEKGDMPLGNSSYSLGVSHYTDNVEKYKQYITALMSHGRTTLATPQDVIDAYCEGAGEHIEWIKSLGVPEDKLYIAGPGKETVEGIGGEYPELPGWDSIGWWATGLTDEIGVPKGPDDGDFPHLPQYLLAKVEEHSDVITYKTQSPVTDLVQDSESKAILGVVINGTTNIKANKGVILALGGFESNPKMLGDYIGQAEAKPCVELDGNTGDGILMCLRAGANLWHMNAVGFWMGQRNLDNTKWTVSQLALPSPKEHGITVGVNGRRFYMDWDGYRANTFKDPVGGDLSLVVGNRHGHMNFGGEWPHLPFPSKAWFIFDADGLKAGAIDDDDPVGNKLCYSANTIEELAAKIKVPAAELVKTVSTYNGFAAAGEDIAFHRPADKMPPIKTAPFYAQLCVPCFMNTMGGAERNGKGEVLDTAGKPIKGLYSAGEFGSIWGNLYNGGGNISETMVFGRISARSCIGA